MVKYFTKQEAREQITNYLNDDWVNSDNNFSDIFNGIFNSDYYIIGTAKAAAALDTYSTLGAFDAIQTIKQYEQDNFGTVNTDLTNPEQVANMLEYIVGEEVFSDALDTVDLNWDDQATRQNCQQFLRAF
ncbi:hypothetical protein [Limosilactobacillus antri]|uniref:hypothetical protein n=1 Tax=Limosilactobacillus antri TaxID=227943 RepID=UPI001F5A8FCB|nr:hypothetical protein [Limosilactobacillus antri]